ncbi:MAG TPA: MFS transporter [Jatrophihabitantaceae bacterium]|nr:MFS transporter [Jatrophihabitantaceae bacterium]
MTAADVRPVPTVHRSHTVLLVVALALTGLTMRTAVTSVGAVLDDLEHGLHTSSGVAGLITTLPVICFAGVGSLAPRLAARTGPHRLLVLALLVSAVGLAARAVVGSIWIFLLLSILGLSGGAVANVLLPSLVKLHFPDRIGPMTAVYTTALAVGTTVAAGLTVPIGELGDGWRFGIGSWALFAAVAVLPWLPTVVHEIRPRVDQHRLSARSLVRSRTAWALTAFFAAQSTTAYMAFGWMARFMHAHGVAESTAGWMVALMSALGIPVSMAIPNVPSRHHRALVMSLGGCFACAYVGLGLAPVGGAWVWMVLYGIGNGMFPLALTMIGLRSRTPETTAALSAFVQAIGYIVAGTGPLLFGVLYGATGSWTLPLMLLWIALGLSLITGWLACAPRFVDDELVAQ